MKSVSKEIFSDSTRIIKHQEVIKKGFLTFYKSPIDNKTDFLNRAGAFFKQTTNYSWDSKNDFCSSNFSKVTYKKSELVEMLKKEKLMSANILIENGNEIVNLSIAFELITLSTLKSQNPAIEEITHFSQYLSKRNISLSKYQTKQPKCDAEIIYDRKSHYFDVKDSKWSASNKNSLLSINLDPDKRQFVSNLNTPIHYDQVIYDQRKYLLMVREKFDNSIDLKKIDAMVDELQTDQPMEKTITNMNKLKLDFRLTAREQKIVFYPQLEVVNTTFNKPIEHIISPTLTNCALQSYNNLFDKRLSRTVWCKHMLTEDPDLRPLRKNILLSNPQFQPSGLSECLLNMIGNNDLHD